MSLAKQLAAGLLGLAVAASVGAADYQGQERWWKGNTHTHSWWSDGDTPPEVIADWYKRNGYHFLVLSDHNQMQRGEKWYPIEGEGVRRAEQISSAYETYVEMFGDDWVEQRTVDGDTQVRLKALTEFRSLFEEPERFIFVAGEEISDRYGKHPVHLNGVNLVELVEPQGGTSVENTMQNNIDAVREQSRRFGQPMFTHVNHPNFHYAIRPEDFFHLDLAPGDGFFEIYNGHPGVGNHGDHQHQSTERMWDIVLSKRLGELDRSVIYGVAVDDAHEYTRWGVGETNPGRGWIMVRSSWLTPNAITQAIRDGDFYSSTGVTLRSFEADQRGLRLAVEPEDGVSYRIEFVGTRRDADLSGTPHRVRLDHAHGDQALSAPARSMLRKGIEEHEVIRYGERIGEVLAVVEGPEGAYEITGDELYVRARVVSDRAHPNPHAEGDVEKAWTQPVVVDVRNADR